MCKTAFPLRNHPPPPTETYSRFEPFRQIPERLLHPANSAASGSKPGWKFIYFEAINIYEHFNASDALSSSRRLVSKRKRKRSQTDKRAAENWRRSFRLVLSGMWRTFAARRHHCRGALWARVRFVEFGRCF